MYEYYNANDLIFFCRDILFTQPTQLSEVDQLLLLIPELYLFYSFFLLFICCLIWKNQRLFLNANLRYAQIYVNITNCIRKLSILILLFTLMLYWNMPYVNILMFEHMHYYTSPVLWMKICIIILFIIFLVTCNLTTVSFEFYLYFLINLISLLLLTSTSNFLSFFLCLELLTFSTYMLLTYQSSSCFVIEAGLKYFFLTLL